MNTDLLYTMWWSLIVLDCYIFLWTGTEGSMQKNHFEPRRSQWKTTHDTARVASKLCKPRLV